MSLKDARLARDAARLRVKGDRGTLGVDIVQEKRAAREEAKAVEIKLSLPAFEECAERRLAAETVRRGRAPSHEDGQSRS